MSASDHVSTCCIVNDKKAMTKSETADECRAYMRQRQGDSLSLPLGQFARTDESKQLYLQVVRTDVYSGIL
jgi:hypothetical protein